MQDNCIKAIQILQQGDVQTAFKILQQEVNQRYQDWVVHYYIGMAGRMIGDLDLAAKHYNKALELDGGNISTYKGLGVVYQLREEYELAIDFLHKAHLIDTRSVDILISLGLTYKKKGDIDQAIQVYQRAIRQHIDNISDRLKETGNPLLKQVQTKEGKRVGMINTDVFQRMPEELRKDLLYSTLQNNLGVCYAIIGDKVKATEAYQESIEFIPPGLDYKAPYFGLQQLKDSE